MFGVMAFQFVRENIVLRCTGGSGIGPGQGTHELLYLQTEEG